MANQEHLNLLKQGNQVWRRWRIRSEIEPDLSEANLNGMDLRYFDFRDTDLSKANLQDANLDFAILRSANLSNANLGRASLSFATLNDACFSQTDLTEANMSMALLTGVDLSEANLTRTNFSLAHLSGANLINIKPPPIYIHAADRGNYFDHPRIDRLQTALVEANLSGAWLDKVSLDQANLSRANLSQAKLRWASFNEANLSEANLSGADLTGVDFGKAKLNGANLEQANLSWANLSEADLSGANLTGCTIYAISAWNVHLANAIQAGLIIARDGESKITVDNLKVAQFIYLLLNNAEIREIIDTITSKVVLILGRFTPERKAVLDALREELRKYNYSPVLFDFEKPASRDLTETISTLAHLARFIIVDLTDPSSVPHEVATVIPHTVVPVQPLLLQEPLTVDGKMMERREYALFEDLRRRYHWVLPTFRYRDTADLLAAIQAQVIEPAEQKVKELTGSKKRIVSSDTHTIGL